MLMHHSCCVKPVARASGSHEGIARSGRPARLTAKELSINHRTVEQHRSRFLEKLDVSAVTELMSLAFERAFG